MTTQRCRVCQCLDDYACLGPDGTTCSWVSWDLCSACVGRERPALDRFLEDVVDPLVGYAAFVLIAGLVVVFGGRFLLSLL